MGDHIEKNPEQYNYRVKARGLSDIRNSKMPEIGTKSSDSVMTTAVNNMNV
jgi:hypothetical protein